MTFATMLVSSPNVRVIAEVEQQRPEARIDVFRCRHPLFAPI
ncbi:MAG: hypothetical protein ACXW6R_27495 [Candidatus Binatia bacterium]